MIVQNITKKTIVADNLQIAGDFYTNLVGLLSKKNSRSLIIKTRFGIHTFGLNQPIDVIVLNSKMQVVRTEVVKPLRVFIFNPKYNLVLELLPESINKSKTQIGDQLKIKQ